MNKFIFLQLSELESALARERGQQSSSGVEVTQLRVVVEDLRRRTAELEESNRTLGLRSSHLTAELRDAEGVHNAQVGLRCNLLFWFIFVDGGKTQRD